MLKKTTNKKILIVGALEFGDIDETFSYSCSSLQDVEYLISLKKQLNVHLKVNTGMNRFGFKNIKSFKKALNLISHSMLNIEGIFTHFATCDEFVNEQTKRFKRFIRIVNDFGYFPIIHADNSSVNEKYNHYFDMVRIGFNLYNKSDGWFLPIVEIKSNIVQIHKVKKNELVGYNYRCVADKNMKIAIVPIGYADGFSLQCIGFNLLVKGVECKVLNVCMDCFMLDVSKVNIKKGEEIYLLNKFNSLTKYSKHIGISEYEVMSRFSQLRCKRVVI